MSKLSGAPLPSIELSMNLLGSPSQEMTQSQDNDDAGSSGGDTNIDHRDTDSSMINRKRYEGSNDHRFDRHLSSSHGRQSLSSSQRRGHYDYIDDNFSHNNDHHNHHDDHRFGEISSSYINEQDTFPSSQISSFSRQLSTEDITITSTDGDDDDKQRQSKGGICDNDNENDEKHYSKVLEETNTMIQELESYKETLHMLSIDNAVLLDRLAMTGADL